MTLEKQYNVETKYYAMDFTKGSEQDYKGLQQLVNPIEVTVLGKNVAICRSTI